MLPRLTLLLLLTLPAAAAPLLEKSNLFSAGQGGYALYRIPGLVVTANGTVLAYCEARKNDAGDWGQIDLLLRRSTDGGKTFDAPRKIAEAPAGVARNPVALRQNLGREGEITLNNPLAIADRSGAVHFLFCVEYARCFYTRSDDDGLTFSPPTDITPAFDAFRPEYDWNVLATGPGHGIQLQNGRLLVPVWLSLGTGGHAHRPSCVSTIYSDDAGKTWKRGDIVANDPAPKNPSETAAVELADGRVMLNLRHESVPRLRAVSISPDGATRWSKPALHDQLPDPVCMGSLVRLPGDKNRILFSNLHNPETRQRKNLTVKLTYDDGRTWPVAKTLEPATSGYSDLATLPDGTLLCLYELGGLNNQQFKTAHLSLARFNLQWLSDGKDTLEPAANSAKRKDGTADERR